MWLHLLRAWVDVVRRQVAEAWAWSESTWRILHSLYQTPEEPQSRARVSKIRRFKVLWCELDTLKVTYVWSLFGWGWVFLYYKLSAVDHLFISSLSLCLCERVWSSCSLSLMSVLISSRSVSNRWNSLSIFGSLSYWSLRILNTSTSSVTKLLKSSVTRRVKQDSGVIRMLQQSEARSSFCSWVLLCVHGFFTWCSSFCSVCSFFLHEGYCKLHYYCSSVCCPD